MSGQKIINGLQEAIAGKVGRVTHFLPGLPGAWEGDAKSIAVLLRFMHGQLTQISFGVPEGEFVMVMKSLTGECERAMRFAEGYAAALQPKQDND